MGWNVVADENGIYPEKMGTAAKLEFEIEGQNEERTAEEWWAWHDKDSARWSESTEEAERRCSGWVAGHGSDGPEE